MPQNTVHNNEKTRPATPLALHHISVDCVVAAFDGQKLRVLLLRRKIEEDGREILDYKLPGALIYLDEDLDAASGRILKELCGLKVSEMHQFKAYGSKDRTRATRDVFWLEKAQNVRVERIVTIAYFGMVKLSSRIISRTSNYGAEWIEVDSLPSLAFDHSQIVSDAVAFLRRSAESEPSLLFDLLPAKFTANTMRILYEAVSGRTFDIGNFHKRIKAMSYVVPLDEYETDVSHRAARFFRFDRIIYNKTRK